MTSKEVSKKSFSIVNKAFLFVLIYYLLNLSSTINQIYKPHITLSLLLLGLYFVIHCGVMGAILRIIGGEKVNFKLFIEGIKFTFLRYIGAFIILGVLIVICFIPYFIFTNLTKGNMAIEEAMKTMPSSVIRSLSMLLLTILSIYIFPFVFVKGEGADAVLDGIKYLCKNFRKSTALIVMGIIKIVILTFILGFALKYPYKSWQYISLISISSLISIYIELAIFAGACYLLLSEKT